MGSNNVIVSGGSFTQLTIRQFEVLGNLRNYMVI